jgi:serine/threonine-protein kinase
MGDLPDSLRSALADRYRLTREIGRGGMATVYLAQDLRHDRKVALKVLRPELREVGQRMTGAGMSLDLIRGTGARR